MKSTTTPSEFVCDTYLLLHERTLAITGLWPTKISARLPSSWPKTLGYVLDRIWMLFLFLNNVHLAACQVKTVHDKWGTSIDDLFVHGQEYLVCHTMSLLTILFHWQFESFAKLFHIINHRMRPRSAPGMTYTSMEKCYKFTQKLSAIYIFFCVAGVLHHCMSPIWEAERRLPIATWYPFDELQSPYYEVVYALQTISTLQSGVMYSEILLLPFAITAFLCAQYDLLYCSLHNLLHTAMLRRGDQKYLDYLQRKQVGWKERNKDWVQYVYSEEYMEELPKTTSGSQSNAIQSELEGVHWEVEEQWRSFDKEIMELLTDCAIFHEFIMRTARETERCLRMVLAAVLVHLILLLCLLLYAASRHLVFDNTLTHVLMYSSLTYALAFLMCFPAHILVIQVSRNGDFVLLKFSTMRLLCFRALELRTLSSSRLGTRLGLKLGRRWSY